MDVCIYPGASPENEAVIPSSKSLSHRALIASALADGESRICRLVRNKDTEATIRCLQALGASFEEKENCLVVHGIRDLSAYDGAVLDAGESGSTLRFLIPLFSETGKKAVFTGHGKLMERPQTVYKDLFRKNHLSFVQNEDSITLEGKLPSGVYEIDGSISSQFISGLLFALPLLEKDSEIHIHEPYESRSYVGLTEDALAKAGIRIIDERTVIHIPGGQKYMPFETSIAGDDSQAAFPAAFSLLTGHAVQIHGIDHDSRQGDHVIFSLLEKMGARTEETTDGYQILPGCLKAVEADLADCPDLGPVLFALAAKADGISIFHNVQRLRMKESDRIACMEEELKKLGCSIASDESTVQVKGPAKIRGNAVLSGHNDHRIVMALAVLCASAEQPCVIQGAEAVAKSWPSFFRDMQHAGMISEVKK